MTAKRNDRTAIEIRGQVPRPAHLGVVPRTACEGSPATTVEPTAVLRELSVRAENVLKMLALELTGDNPPQGRWTPPDPLLQKLTYRHLSTARNCGPQTTAEIVRWAEIEREDSPGPAPRQPVTIGHVARIDIEVFGG